jgi:hypothetical protein
MTLMDAPKFDSARSRRRTQTVYAFFGGFFLLIIAAWLIVGHPIDAPWNWWAYWTGQHTTDKFLRAVENNDLPRAYGIWENDAEWKQHPDKFGAYTFERFQQDWGSTSSANEYGAIASHQIVVAKTRPTDVVVGSMINGRKSKPLFLAYGRQDHKLNFSPVELTIDR